MRYFIKTPAYAEVLGALFLLCLFVCSGCNGSGDGTGKTQFISVGTAPAGGAFFPVGSAICEVVNDTAGDLNWSVSNSQTGGSMENIRLLTQKKLEFAMSNASITYFAVRGTEGWEQEHEVRSVMTLFPNVANFVTLGNSEIKTVADLKGKRVLLGPEGAGFEYFVVPILEAHGLKLSDLDVRYANQQGATDLLGDGSIAAAVLGGGIPNPAIMQMAQTNPVRLVPFDEDARQKLIAEYSFFEPAIIPAGTYNGIDEDFQGLNVGSAHLITHASVDEEVVYQFTKRVWEHRAKIAEKVKAASNIRAESVAQENGIPYHPGAERYFRENNLWPGTDTK